MNVIKYLVDTKTVVDILPIGSEEADCRDPFDQELVVVGLEDLNAVLLTNFQVGQTSKKILYPLAWNFHLDC